MFGLPRPGHGRKSWAHVAADSLWLDISPSTIQQCLGHGRKFIFFFVTCILSHEEREREDEKSKRDEGGWFHLFIADVASRYIQIFIPNIIMHHVIYNLSVFSHYLLDEPTI